MNVPIPQFIKYWYPQIFKTEPKYKLHDFDLNVKCFDDIICSLLMDNDRFIIINKNILKMQELLEDFKDEQFVAMDINLLKQLKDNKFLEYNYETLTEIELKLLCLVPSK